MYDDRWLCINAQNKGGKPIQDIDSFLNSQLKETMASINMTIPSSPVIKGNTKALHDGDVVVYLILLVAKSPLNISVKARVH